MANQVIGGIVAPDDGEHDHNFVPDFAWAAVGGLAVLALSVVVYTLAATLGGSGAPLSLYSRELAGLFLSGFLVVLIARAVSVQTR